MDDTILKIAEIEYDLIKQNKKYIKISHAYRGYSKKVSFIIDKLTEDFYNYSVIYHNPKNSKIQKLFTSKHKKKDFYNWFLKGGHKPFLFAILFTRIEDEM